MGLVGDGLERARRPRARVVIGGIVADRWQFGFPLFCAPLAPRREAALDAVHAEPPGAH